LKKDSVLKEDIENQLLALQ